GGTNGFTVGNNFGPGVSGTIQASAGQTGNAGSVTITNNGFGGIFIDNLDDIVLGVTRGNGGSLTLRAPNSAIVTAGGSVSVDGQDNGLGGTFNGGTISMAAGAIFVVSNGSPSDLSAAGA